MVTVEIAAAAGYVGLVITDDGNGNHTEIVMDPDEARGLCNGLGEAIQAASAIRTGVLS